MADYGQRSMPRPGKGPERTETSDVDRFQFWPDAIAMGSLKGRQFTQVSVQLFCDNDVSDIPRYSERLVSKAMTKEATVGPSWLSISSAKSSLSKPK